MSVEAVQAEDQAPARRLPWLRRLPRLSRLPGKPADPLLAVAVVLAVAAAVFAAVSGWAWLSAPRVSPLAVARDQALREGEQAVLNFNTLDYRHVSQGLALWAQSSAGPLHTQVVAGQAAFAQQIRQARTITTARILDASLTSLNAAAGKARIIVALQLTVTPASGTPAVKQERLVGVLVKTLAGWKLSQLGQAPVVSGSGGQ